MISKKPRFENGREARANVVDDSISRVRIRAQQTAELSAIERADTFVGIDREDPFASGVPEAFVSSRCEIACPLEIKDSRPAFSGDLLRSVPGTRIDNDNFIDKWLNRTKALCQKLLLVLDDEARGNQNRGHGSTAGKS